MGNEQTLPWLRVLRVLHPPPCATSKGLLNNEDPAHCFGPEPQIQTLGPGGTKHPPRNPIAPLEKVVAVWGTVGLGGAGAPMVAVSPPQGPIENCGVLLRGGRGGTGLGRWGWQRGAEHQEGPVPLETVSVVALKVMQPQRDLEPPVFSQDQAGSHLHVHGGGGNTPNPALTPKTSSNPNTSQCEEPPVL